MDELLAILPGLDSKYPISTEQRDQYQRDGHIVLRGVASAEEVAAYRPLIAGAVERLNTEKRKLEDRDTYKKAFLQIGNIWERDEAVARFVLARRFAQIAADLMGVDGVRLYHDQALFKEPHGGPTPWHQDQYYWPLGTDNTITMWMPLVDAPIEMGTMSFATGSHREGAYALLNISDESEQILSQLVKDRGFKLTQSSLSAGDATFHSGWTLHSAPGNKTDRMREVMTVIYYADGARVVEPDNPHRPKDLERWFPGLSSGDMAASELNPLLFHRHK